MLGKAEAPSNLWWKYAELQEEDLLNHVKNGQVQRCFDSRQHAPLKPALSNSDVRVSQSFGVYRLPSLLDFPLTCQKFSKLVRGTPAPMLGVF